MVTILLPALQIDRDHSGLIEREEFEDALREMKKSEARFHTVARLPPGMQPQGATDNAQRAAMWRAAVVR